MLDIWGLPHLVKLACYIYSSESQSEGFKKKNPQKPQAIIIYGGLIISIEMKVKCVIL